MVDKVLYRNAGETKQYTPITASAGAGDAGKIDQKLGMAKSATELVTDDYDYVVL